MDELDIYLKEDLGDKGDITSESLFTDEMAKGKIVCKENCVIAGLKESKKIFEKLGAKIKFNVKDGDKINKGTIVAEVSGSAISILKGERLALNFIGKMSGIATETKKIVDKCKKVNPNVTIAATRKTTPGFRKFEKKAVEIGGGKPHRFGLYDAIMIKDNHIKIIGSVENAIRKIKNKTKGKPIEIEVQNEKEAITAAKLNVDVIMLDNFTSKNAKVTSQKIRRINPKILLEISGGVNQKNILDYASFADRISLGYLTHSIKSIDFSLEIV
jgi:nicotinate-nucleotide pyrophosphorylase (carboxylating)